MEPELVQDNVLKKIIDEETPLIGGKQSTGTSGGGDAGSKFLTGISEKEFWFIFTGILIVNFVGAFDSTIMASTHTSVTSAFNSSNSASWLSTSFLLASTSFQPIYGRASDVIGRRIPFVVALVLFTSGTLWCATAQSIGSFIAARALCGVGCGGVWTMGAIVLSDIVPIEIRGTYQSWNNLTYGLGSMMGAALGGFMADQLGWRWAFGVQVPPALLCTAIISYTSPGSISISQTLPKKKKLPKFDFRGCFLLLVSTALLVLGLSTGGNVFPWTSPFVISSLVMGSILWALFIVVEKTAEAPIMPLKMVWNRPRNFLVFSNFLYTVGMNSIIFNLPLYFQAVCLTTATTAGTRMLIPSISGTISGVSTGIIIVATGRLRPTLLLGAALILFGSILIATMKPTYSPLQYFFILIPANLGIGFNFPSTIMSMLAVSTQKDQAVATSTLLLWRSLGSVVGVASGSLIVQNLLKWGLEREVDGSGWGMTREQDELVREMVRRSVESVVGLEGEYQRQVVKAYEGALKGAFWWAVMATVVSGVMVCSIRVPKLGAVGEYRKVEEMEEEFRDEQMEQQ
ncbi:MFS general substrate transporter [Terfezia boudieri ATCC MYA-4762]|uniref:MFS general substrate transporter n=1 Tax=Terfezia boudieri ATCC MYA-4762 TaxID=1051890 RepID=A0A3N4LWD8_9PEZI|nr:MFS general substrate transporter [Terfezia boudieri ATCC MYA-4762]